MTIPHGNSTWTETRDDELRALWVEFPRKSAAQIGDAMGGITRNAILGRANRIGLNRKEYIGIVVAADRPVRVRVRKPRWRKPPGPEANVSVIPVRRVRDAASGMAPPPPPNAPEPLPPIQPTDIGRCSIMELDGTKCRYPIDTDTVFMFCGLPPQEGSVYCPEHNRRCRIPRGTAPSRPYFSDRSK